MIALSKRLLFAIIVILSSLYGQRFHESLNFEVGGGVNLLMPRQKYNNGWGIGLDGVYNLSSRYGVNLAYGSTKVEAITGQSSHTVTSVIASIEISFRRGDYVHGFTTIGLGNVSGEENTLFVFGIGIKIPVYQKFLIRLELRDFFTEVGIPYFTFPGGRAALQGLGEDKYLELGLGIAYTFGKMREAMPERPHGR